MSEAKECQDCKQIIQYHEGLNRVINIYAGAGGEVGEDHLCPDRVGSKFHHTLRINPARMFLVRRCSSCSFPHYMHMACPMCYDDNYFPRIESSFDYSKGVKKALIPYNINKNTRQLEIYDFDLDLMEDGTGRAYKTLGDIHDPNTWKKFADLQRELIRELNIKSI